jgi:hypothetical protein
LELFEGFASRGSVPAELVQLLEANLATDDALDDVSPVQAVHAVGSEHSSLSFLHAEDSILVSRTSHSRLKHAVLLDFF